MSCPRCQSADLAVTDASDDDGFQIVCYACGLVWRTLELT